MWRSFVRKGRQVIRLPFLKPLLLGRGVEVPMLIILIGAIGGMIRAGIIGLFVGAVVLAPNGTGDLQALMADLEAAEPPRPPPTAETPPLIAITPPSPDNPGVLDALPPNAAIEAIDKRLRSSNPAVRADAVRVLGRLGTVDAVMMLGQVALGDSDTRVRINATRALRDISSERSLVLVQALLRDGDINVRRAAGAPD